MQSETAQHSLADELKLHDIQKPELYEPMDWLFQRQKRIEKKLAKKHLQDGTLVLYDVSSSYSTVRRRPSRKSKSGARRRVFPCRVFNVS
jgi:hypothetical protein